MKWKLLGIFLVSAAIVFSVIAGAGLFESSANPKPAEAGAIPSRFFDWSCNLSFEGNIDPLKFPGQQNSTHIHQFACGTNVTPNSTEASLKAANANGNSCDQSTYPNIPVGCSTTSGPYGIVTNPPGGQCAFYDASGNCPAFREASGDLGWRPGLFDCGTTPPPIPDSVNDPNCHEMLPTTFHFYAFAKQLPSVDGGPTVQVFPPNFGEIEGSKTVDNSGASCTPDSASNPDGASSCQHEFRCLADPNGHATYTSVDNGAEQDYQGYNPAVGFLCNGNNGKAVIEANTHFAECWNGTPFVAGQAITSGQNVAYAVNKQCPAGYPNLLPAVDMQVQYHIQQNGIPHFYLESINQTQLGSTAGDHGDYLPAWDTSPSGSDPAASSELEHLLRDCLNQRTSQVPGCNTNPQ